MFSQLLTPVGDSLALSFLVALLPIVTVLVLLGLLRLPAWITAGAGLIVALAIAVGVWQMPARPCARTRLPTGRFSRFGRSCGSCSTRFALQYRG